MVLTLVCLRILLTFPAQTLDDFRKPPPFARAYCNTQKNTKYSTYWWLHSPDKFMTGFSTDNKHFQTRQRQLSHGAVVNFPKSDLYPMISQFEVPSTIWFHQTSKFQNLPAFDLPTKWRTRVDTSCCGLLCSRTFRVLLRGWLKSVNNEKIHSVMFEQWLIKPTRQ